MPKPIGGGLATWSIRHPVGVVSITLAVMVLGAFALERLGIDLLPHIIYPEVRVRVLDPGVPAGIMEDEITRQLEEQLAITEDAVAIQSRTSEGRSSVDLSFEYGKDIDVALRDASTRLDRAQRFLPETVEPPIIYKRDPSQRPVVEYMVSSGLRDPVDLRAWVDYRLSKWLLNIPGVAAAEVGGGLVREIQVWVDQDRLAGLGLDILDLRELLEGSNRDVPAGRLLMAGGEIAGRTSGRFASAQDLLALPVEIGEGSATPLTLGLGELAQVVDGSEDERLRIRLDGLPGVKLSIQKQPGANTVAVVDRVAAELQRLEADRLIPPEIQVRSVDDEARYVRQSLDNAVSAALSGALLAMAVVYLFLGSLRRTLIIGSAIPIAILVTFILMAAGGLTLNIMTLGGLALGVGMLVDNTIVMLENIYRHQRWGESAAEASTRAAAEVSSAVIAATTTNLAAVLPFLFIGGLIGLLFRELIFTISAAILASLVVALTLVPALAGRLPAGRDGLLRRGMNSVMTRLQDGYAAGLGWVLRAPWLVLVLFLAGLALSVAVLLDARQVFLPEMDDGRISVSITADPGVNLETMDSLARRIEDMLREQPEVEMLFTTVGGSVFGRSQFEAPNQASIQVRLKPLAERSLSSRQWIGRMERAIGEARIPGMRVSLRVQGIRGINLSSGDDDLTLRIQGPDLRQLDASAGKVAERLRRLAELRNVQHSSEERTQELSVQVDREKARLHGLSVSDVGEVLRFALEGVAVTEIIADDRSFDVRLRLDRRDVATPEDLASIVLMSRSGPRPTPLRLGDIARVELAATPAEILRDRQQRVVEVSASLAGDTTLSEAMQAVDGALSGLDLPPGYRLYEAGSLESLQAGRDMAAVLLGLALFLVFVVMAVQYESLRNPLVIMLSVPFGIIGVAATLHWGAVPLSMPVWLGLIMLAGIVVNNAILLVEYIELERHRGMAMPEAILQAGRLRLRPILMTTLTTVVGMLPLSLGLGEGAEMLQPLAVTIVAGLSFSTLVSLVLIPIVYRIFAAPGQPAQTR